MAVIFLPMQQFSRPEGGENLVLVLEITVGSHGAHPQPLGEFAHVEPFAASFGEQFVRDIAQAVAKIGDDGGDGRQSPKGLDSLDRKAFHLKLDDPLVLSAGLDAARLRARGRT